MTASAPSDYSRDSQGDTAAPTPRLIPLGNLLGELNADAVAAHDSYKTGKPRGPVTGFGKLDQKIGGALAPGVHIVHGGPGVGKSAFVWQMAAKSHCPALFVSCEMGPLEMLRRLMARTTKQFLGRLKSGELAPDHMLQLARQAIATAPQLVIADGTQAFIDADWIARAAMAVRREERDMLIIVDSLHSWAEGYEGGSSEYETLNQATAALRTLAAGLNCPIVAVAERNRAGMKTGGMHAGAGSRKLEYGAESVFELDCAEESKPDGNGQVDVTLRVSKNRHGTVGSACVLKFHGALQEFTDPFEG